MKPNASRVIAFLTALALVAPSVASAGHKRKCADCLGGCHEWKLTEIEETVYEVTYKDVKKTIRRPIIKEIKTPVSCKVCKPFSRTVLREFCVPDYCRSGQTVNETVRRQHVDECGNCSETCEVIPKLVTCLVKTMVPQLVPVLEWELIAVEDVHEESHLVREFVDVEVTVSVPVKTPKTIRRKVWRRIPTCRPCDSCENGCGDSGRCAVSK